ncbi:MAG: CPBP family intramembrane metalloprotease [Anaerolineae bacterium]|nr:CPBP family intramembrane metalloprotease [Anaerolineae bacterium]
MTSESTRKLSGWWASIRTVLLVVGVLILAQGIRKLLFWLGWRLAQPGPDGWAWEALSILSFLLTGTILWLVLRPAGRDLGLDWGTMQRIGRASVLAGGALLLALLISSALLDSSLLLANLHSVLVVPLFEEAIFRGWGWSRLERSLSGRLAGFLTYLVVTGLFALWHLGYGDVVYLRGLGSQTADPPLRVILFYKVLAGGAVGLLAGFARWRTGKLYWPFLLHGFWNMFGR